MNLVLDSANPFAEPHGAFLSDVAERLDAQDGLALTLLDRGNLASLPCRDRVEFPSYSPHRFNAADSILLQKICDHLRADYFISLITTPLRTPMVLLVSASAVPDDASERLRGELALALAYCEAISVEGDGRTGGYPKTLASVKHKVVPDLARHLSWEGKSDLKRHPSFYEGWSDLRHIQSEVDAVIWDPS